jgi:hypothetical protein
MRGRWFFFADGPNARGMIQTGFALHDPRYARAQHLTRSIASTQT